VLRRPWRRSRPSVGACSLTKPKYLIEPSGSVSPSIPAEKPIEFPQSIFAAGITISQALFELKERPEVSSQVTVEEHGHRGTGRATVRSRRKATRTYTEV
jgi:hypothetical protein